MTTYVYRAGELVEKDRAEPLHVIRARSDLPSPFVSLDTMDETRHMADGKFYTSKSEFRRVTKAHGCVEVGDQKDFGRRRKMVPKLDKRQRKDDIRKAVYELKNGKRASR